jgi:hypothetical protein
LLVALGRGPILTPSPVEKIAGLPLGRRPILTLSDVEELLVALGRRPILTPSPVEKIAGLPLGQRGFFNFYGKMNSFLRIWVPQFRSSLSTKVQIRISGRSVSRPKGKRSWFTTEGVLLCFQSRIALLSG